jgi:fluoride ion exporter CrcB/FEX
MGTLVDNKTELESLCVILDWVHTVPRSPPYSSLPLYIGLTTGFCGAMTTFSGFALSVFQGFANTGSSPRGRLYDVRLLLS